MTEGEKAYFKRRWWEEQRGAHDTGDLALREPHWKRAQYYEDRLNGVPQGADQPPAAETGHVTAA